MSRQAPARAPAPHVPPAAPPAPSLAQPTSPARAPPGGGSAPVSVTSSKVTLGANLGNQGNIILDSQSGGSVALAVTDTLSGPWATINAPDLPLDRVTNQLIALRKVLGRRADITIMNNLIAGDLIRSNRAEEEISSIPAVVDAQSLYHLGLRADLPGGAALTAELDQIIQRPEIRRAIDTVLAKYL